MRLEKELYKAVDNRLPVSIHRQSMTGAAMTANGTPDRYYDGTRRDLWVEYKILKGIPRSGIVVGDYTKLQLAWLERRHKIGQNAIGIVGLPNRTAVLQCTPIEWREGSPIANAVPLKDVAMWIESFVGS